LAGFLAYVLHVALDDIGLSGDAVVTVVTVLAALVALVAIQFFGNKLGAPNENSNLHAKPDKTSASFQYQRKIPDIVSMSSFT
jgi:hypothetical protein